MTSHNLKKFTIKGSKFISSSLEVCLCISQTQQFFDKLRYAAAVACIFFTPFFSVVYNQERLTLQAYRHFTKHGYLDLKLGVYNQEWVKFDKD